MSFGVYRPSLGAASGMRQLSSDFSLQDQRRIGERNGRQGQGGINPITGEPSSGYRAPSPVPVRRPPSGNLQAGLHPVSGPLDPMTVPNKDVSGKKVDPTRNASSNFMGGEGFCVPKCDEQPARSVSRLTQGNLEVNEAGLGGREATPERRSTPGQVLRAGLRPKDNLSGVACMAGDKQDHPLALPRKAGSAAAGVGTGGSVHLVAGPNGFVPAGPGYEDDLQMQAQAKLGAAAAPSGFKPLWGGV
eukprot:TRINITY_DN110650_c0_g1_i1.p1 TRINITY_DN110650_c0_g1~~TRINITY_DN110650_c0_g1_i1.p1  ORF type:complete len:259 (-),score=46.77 TRINITY_DN110650_c0_g1_i1:58-795(-)